MDSNINEESEKNVKETINAAAPTPKDGVTIENAVKQLREEFKNAQERYIEKVLDEEKKILTQWQNDFSQRIDSLNKERNVLVEKTNELALKKKRH